MHLDQLQKEKKKGKAVLCYILNHIHQCRELRGELVRDVLLRHPVICCVLKLYLHGKKEFSSTDL